MTGLRIAQVSPLWSAVPPATYGGVERILHLLTEELVRRGHDVTLIASGDSRTAGDLHPVIDRSLLDTMAEGRAFEEAPYLLEACAIAMRVDQGFDVVHSHLGADFVPLDPLAARPVVHSITHAITVDHRWVLSHHPDARVCFLSDAQRRDAPPLRHARVVPNACDFSKVVPGERSDGYLAFLGRPGPHKGPVTAIDVARRSGRRIVLAGEPMTADERRYFTQEIAPLIDQDRVRYIGAVDDAEKAALLRGAAALLFPIEWEEPFGNVMVEAMACGTPVVALERGAVPEVVDDGVTGFFTRDRDALPTLVERACELDRRRVRARAEARFGVAAMTDRYEAAYRHALGE